MALGLPVLATKVSGMEGEAVVEGETGFLCEAGSIDSLANGIDRMLREVSSWPAMGDAGRRRFVRLFRGDASARRLVEEHYEL
jgi:glycosyltransferase involved in cell wall biosynthesis